MKSNGRENKGKRGKKSVEEERKKEKRKIKHL